MPEIVQFKASQEDQDIIIGILEECPEKARAGSVKDVAVVLAEQKQDGPEFTFTYFGEGAYSSIMSGVSALEFDLHYQRYLEADE